MTCVYAGHLFVAGDVGVEPTSKVLETFILADVLIPFVPRYCSIICPIF